MRNIMTLPKLDLGLPTTCKPCVTYCATTAILPSTPHDAMNCASELE
jgi:formate hydrogenlyase subunit 6/NADH:ubiquinone oxidoreductase subunit I